MELNIKLLKWTAGLPVAMLNEKTARKMGIHTEDRISIKAISKNPKEVSAIIDIIKHLVKENEIAVSSEIKHKLGLRVGQKVDVNLSPPPRSVIFIKKKLNKKTLSKQEISEIIRDVTNNSLSDPEIALFISAMYQQKMSMKETIYLIEAILESGNKLKLRNKFVVDKHSVGGIPGNRTTLIIVPICASAGLIMPKSSSRAITSSAGTADVVETIARVEFSIDEVKKIIKKTNACLVWGGALGMVPADSKIIKIEKQLKIDPEAQFIASIMAKKLAFGAKYILIDIPYGKTAKINKANALKLKRKFEYLGRYFKLILKVVLTEAKEPMGSGVGPALELIDAIKVLDPKQNGPEDLKEKSLFLAGELLEMTGKAKKGEGTKMAEEILDSGKAFEKFKQIIEAQGGILKEIKPAKFKRDILSKKSGRISEIDNKKIISLAAVAGCPADKFAGLYLYFNVGDKIKKHEKLLTIYSESKSRLNQAVRFYNKVKPIKIK